MNDFDNTTEGDVEYLADLVNRLMGMFEKLMDVHTALMMESLEERAEQRAAMDEGE